MKKNKIITGLMFSLCIFTPLSLSAQESNEEIVARLAALGDGVHEIKKNDNGTLKSLKAVGSSRISTVLGKSKGLKMARKKAMMKANAEFVSWMKSEVSSINTDSEETIVTLQGDGENTTEQAISTEMSKSEITKKAQGLVRGLTLVAKDINADGDTMTLVYLWSPKKAAFAKSASHTNNSDDTPSAKKATPPAAKGKVSPKRVVSPGFDED